MRFKKKTPAVKSPCVNICTIENALCSGCLRTIEEIRAWKNATDIEKLSILASVKMRRKLLGV